jgi:hypothetical protein
MITTEQLNNYDLTHDHGGNGLAMVEDIDAEWCRVCSVGLNVNGRIPDARLAWKQKLKLTLTPPKPGDQPAPVLLSAPRPGMDGFLEELYAVRSGIRDGTLKIKDTKIIYPFVPKKSAKK